MKIPYLIETFSIVSVRRTENILRPDLTGRISSLKAFQLQAAGWLASPKHANSFTVSTLICRGFSDHIQMAIKAPSNVSW